MPWLILLIMAQSFAAFNSKDLFEKSFPRDNTFCRLGKERVEFSVRGFSKYTEPRDKGYGELLFMEYQKVKKSLDIAQGNSGLYRFFKGTARVCSKYPSYLIDEKTLALLILKANRPYKDKLIIQLIDTKSLTPLRTIHTDFQADKALPAPKGFYFRTNGNRVDIDMGVVNWDEKKFTYQDRDFQEWYYFNGKDFSLQEKVTYKESPFKIYFTSEDDFLKTFGWSSEEKKFSNKIIYVAVNHSIGKECILVRDSKSKLTGTEEGWRCRKK
jgi:hypothetical protein